MAIATITAFPSEVKLRIIYPSKHTAQSVHDVKMFDKSECQFAIVPCRGLLSTKDAVAFSIAGVVSAKTVGAKIKLVTCEESAAFTKNFASPYFLFVRSCQRKPSGILVCHVVITLMLCYINANKKLMI